MKDYCAYCGDPHPSVFVFTDDKGNERFVHDGCLRGFTQRALGVRVIVPKEGEQDDTRV